MDNISTGVAIHCVDFLDYLNQIQNIDALRHLYETYKELFNDEVNKPVYERDMVKVVDFWNKYKAALYVYRRALNAI